MPEQVVNPARSITDKSESAGVPDLDRVSEKIKLLMKYRLSTLKQAVKAADELYDSSTLQADRDPSIKEWTGIIIKRLESDNLTDIANGIIASGRIPQEVARYRSFSYPPVVVAANIKMFFADPGKLELEKVFSADPDAFGGKGIQEVSRDICYSFALGFDPVAPKALAYRDNLSRHISQIMQALDKRPLLFAVDAAAINGSRLYEKSRIIESIGKSGLIDVAESDKPIVSESKFYNRENGFAESDTMLAVFDDFMLSGELTTFIKEAHPYLSKRAEMLESGPIYIKPFVGAKSESVIRLEIDANRLLIRGDSVILDYLEGSSVPISSFEDLMSLAAQGRLSAMLVNFNREEEGADFLEDFSFPSKEPDRDIRIDGQTYSLKFFLAIGDSVKAININLLQHDCALAVEDTKQLLDVLSSQQKVSVFDFNTEDGLVLTRGNNPDYNPEQYFCARIIQPALYSHFISGAEVRREAADQLAVHLNDTQNLEMLMAGIEFVYLDNQINCYAERGLNVPLYQGRTWEIRVINFDEITDDRPESKAIASYCKVAGINQDGHAQVVNNISTGGSGVATEKLIAAVYTELIPEPQAGTPQASQLKDQRIDAFMKRLHDSAAKAVEAANQHFANEVREKLKVFNAFSDRIRIETCSTDFMVEVRQTDQGPELFPVLIDFNLLYGYEGLKSADPLQAMMVNFRLQDLADMSVRDHLDDYQADC